MCTMQLAHVTGTRHGCKAQLSMPAAEPESELRPKPKGPTSIVGSAAIISASISMTGLGTVLS